MVGGDAGAVVSCLDGGEGGEEVAEGGLGELEGEVLELVPVEEEVG